MAEQDKFTGRLVLAGGIAILIILIALIFMVNNWLKGSLQEMQVKTGQAPDSAVSAAIPAPKKNIRSTAAIMAKAGVEKSAVADKQNKSKIQSIQKEAPILSKVLSE